MSEPLELACCELLLELYRGARELSVAEFPAYAFGLVSGVLRIDAVRYTALKFVDPGAVVCTWHVWNDANDTVLDWEQINRHDTVVPTVLASPGRAFNFHQRTLFAGPGNAIMRDFVERTVHRNNLVIAVRDADEGLWKSLSLYRAGADDRYAERDRRLLEAQACVAHCGLGRRIGGARAGGRQHDALGEPVEADDLPGIVQAARGAGHDEPGHLGRQRDRDHVAVLVEAQEWLRAARHETHLAQVVERGRAADAEIRDGRPGHELAVGGDAA